MKVFTIALVLSVLSAVSECQELRWCCKSDQEYVKCLAMLSNINNRLVPLDPAKPYAQFKCVLSANKSTEDCAALIKTNLADAMTLDAGDIFKYSKQNIVRPLFAENYAEGFGVSYYAVAVVKKSDQNIRFDHLKGYRSCHTGIGKTSGWVAPIGRLVEMGEITPNVHCDVAKAVSDYFAASCAPGAGLREYNPMLSGVDKLCKQCHGNVQNQNKCARNHDEFYYGYQGAFRCLVEGSGDVAFVKHSTVKENTDGNNNDPWAQNLKSEDYEILCTNGTRASIDQFESCHIARNPAHAVVIRSSMASDNVSAVIRLLNASQNMFGPSSKTFHMFQSNVFAGSNLMFKDNTQKLDVITTDYIGYLGEDYTKAVQALDCKEMLRWCCVSLSEELKCKDMAKAFKEKGWKPEITCVGTSDISECLDSLKQGQADILTLDAADAYTGGKDIGMIPVAGEHYGLEELSKYFAVAVVKKESTLQWPDLKGVRSCHTGINKTAGWLVPVGTLIESGQIELDDKCDASKGAGSYFSSSCAPGANTRPYNPLLSNADKLCRNCIGDKSGANKCSRSHTERYYDYSGAFRCLVEGAGDVAFVKHSTVLEHTDGQDTVSSWARDLKSADYKLLCPYGTTKGVKEYKECFLSNVPGHMVMVTPKWKKQTDMIYQLLHTAQTVFKDPVNDTMFSIFTSNKYDGGRDLLFKDGTTNFTKIPKGSTYRDALQDDYLAAIESLNCIGGATVAVKSGFLISLLIFISYAISF